MKSVAVVGADGFMGSAVVKGLCQSGYNPVTITRNCQSENIDTSIVFYLAGSSTPNNSSDDTIFVDYDIDCLKKILNKLKVVKTRPLFVYASSAGAVYDPSGNQPYSESSPVSPFNLYGRGKLVQEALVREAEWVDPLILRLSNIYGPHQKPKSGFGVIAHWAQKVCNNESIEMMGNSGRDYLNISDVVDIMLNILGTSKSTYGGLTINVASGNTVYLSDLYEMFVRAAGYPIDLIKNPPRAFDANCVSFDNSLAKELFKWEPKIPLELGIKGVLEAVLLAKEGKVGSLSIY